MAREFPTEAVPGVGRPGPAAAGAAELEADRRLVAAILRKDRKAAAELVAAHADAVFAYVRRRLAPRLERVDDVVHDVFLAALAGLPSYRGTSPLRAWLLGIARHKIEDFYRQRLREPESLDESGDTAEPSPDGGLPMEERIDRARAVERTQRVLAMLPETYSVVLLWRYWENRSVRAIAASSGKSEKAIERLLARARERFGKLWIEVSHG
jgi:RNA polymerase sigma-70 factor (ECF subfamily)